MNRDDMWGMLTYPFQLPNEHPAIASVLTGLVGLGLAIYGIGLLASGGQYVAGAPLALVPGVVLMGFVVYAGAETGWFQQWASPEPGHLIARWIGPVALGLTLILLAISLVVGVFLACAIISGLANS